MSGHEEIAFAITPDGSPGRKIRLVSEARKRITAYDGATPLGYAIFVPGLGELDPWTVVDATDLRPESAQSLPTRERAVRELKKIAGRRHRKHRVS